MRYDRNNVYEVKYQAPGLWETAARLRDPVEVIFRDEVSEAGAQVSVLAWQI
jgi:hypothetical protein